MKFIRLLRCDFQQGSLRRWYLYLFVFLFSLVICIGVGREWRYSPFLTGCKLTAGNCMASYFQGVEPYVPSSNQPFQLPLEWLLLMFFPICLIGDYVVRDLKGMGQTTLLQSGSRILWWTSKVCWSAVTAISYGGVLFLSAELVSVIMGSASPLPDRVLLSVKLGDTFAEQSTAQLLWNIYGLPLMVIFTNCIMHITLSLFMPPIYSAMLLLSFQVASVYYMTPFLWGEYTMLLRNRLSIENGFSVQTGMLLCTVWIGLSLIVGIVRFCRYDILGKKEV